MYTQPHTMNNIVPKENSSSFVCNCCHIIKKDAAKYPVLCRKFLATVAN